MATKHGLLSLLTHTSRRLHLDIKLSAFSMRTVRGGTDLGARASKVSPAG